MKLTHWQYLQSFKRLFPNARICHPQDINFGGGCFNCGYDPNRDYPIRFEVQA